MNAERILAIFVGTFLACVVTVTAGLYFFSSRVKAAGWYLGFPRQPVACAEFSTRYSMEKPCPPESGGVLVTLDEGRRSRDEPLDEVEFGSRSTHRTLFVRFGSNHFTSHSLFFIINGPFVSVDARFHGCQGTIYGAVRSDLSYVHLHDEKLCFDLTVDPMQGSEYIEHWQGQLRLK